MLRLFFVAFMLVALGAFGWDIWDFATEGEMRLAALGQRLAFFDHTIDLGLQKVINHDWDVPSLWDYLVQPLLLAPAVLVMMGIGLAFELINRLFSN